MGRPRSSPNRGMTSTSMLEGGISTHVTPISTRPSSHDFPVHGFEPTTDPYHVNGHPCPLAWCSASERPSPAPGAGAPVGPLQKLQKASQHDVEGRSQSFGGNRITRTSQSADVSFGTNNQPTKSGVFSSTAWRYCRGLRMHQIDGRVQFSKGRPVPRRQRGCHGLDALSVTGRLVDWSPALHAQLLPRIRPD